MRRLKREIPALKNEEEEFAFWSAQGEGADSTEFLDWSKAERVKFPKLKALPLLHEGERGSG